jgi:ABC-2 type transport system ATP-binding protein
VVARGEIWALLEQARAEALVVMSTSYLDEAAACERLIYLDAGRVVAAGTPAELQAQVPLELYRAWGDDARRIARAARALPYVVGARATGRYARIEVRRGGSPGIDGVLRDLSLLLGAAVQLAEALPVDMESTLLSLAATGEAV